MNSVHINLTTLIKWINSSNNGNYHNPPNMKENFNSLINSEEMEFEIKMHPQKGNF